MTFNQLQKYLTEDNPVTLDHLEEDSYRAKNCVSFQECEIERLHEYSIVTLCHYFYELGIPSPKFMRADFNNYRAFRNKLFKDYSIPEVEIKHLEKIEDLESGYEEDEEQE